MNFDPLTFRLNSPLGKSILAATREGNYAHPGEEEAIIHTLKPWAAKATGRRWLDAGCGKGGTAAFVMHQGWADVTAFDIDGVSIQEAQQTYPGVRFHACGVLDARAAIEEKFDLIYAFNAFYAFPDQPGSLRALRSMGTDSATLVLFDYTDIGGFMDSSLAKRPEGQHWQPIDLNTFPKTLADAGWKLESVENLDADYERWYAWLVERFTSRREALLEFAPQEAIDHARDFYALLLKMVQTSVMGGSILIAQAA